MTTIFRNTIRTAVIGGVFCFAACTDLEVKEKDSVVTQTTTEFSGVDAAATLSSAYADLREFGDQANIYALLEVTSDELVVPTRGTDWGDNGIWRSLHLHTWTDQHQYVLNAWNSLNRNIFKINQILAPQSNASAVQVAEARFLRAFNMWYVLDLYRQVPFREVNEGVNVDPKVFTVQESIAFITADLEAAIAGLPSVAGGTTTVRASKAAANFFLAKLFLNKHVYLEQEPAAADMTRVIQAVDAIEADGYTLQDDYFDIFVNAQNPETIMWTDASWGNRIWAGLHYNHRVKSNTGGGWNGFSTTGEFYSLFEGNPDNNELGNNQEERRGYVVSGQNYELDGIGYGFLVGQQYDSTGAQLKDRPGNPLIFTKEFENETLTGNNERQGIRVIKYHPRHGSFNSYYVLARFADAHLMKIEAILRGGTSGETALQLYNELRGLREASPAASVTLDNVIDERGRELYIEGWRRNDLVRFNKFTEAFEYKPATEEYREVFPIPANALSTNPNLKQNEGY